MTIWSPAGLWRNTWTISVSFVAHLAGNILQISPAKWTFAAAKVDFLGHLVDSRGIRPLSDYAEASKPHQFLLAVPVWNCRYPEAAHRCIAGRRHVTADLQPCSPPSKPPRMPSPLPLTCFTHLLKKASKYQIHMQEQCCTTSASQQFSKTFSLLL
jgi:hypothetical protein